MSRHNKLFSRHRDSSVRKLADGSNSQVKVEDFYAQGFWWRSAFPVDNSQNSKRRIEIWEIRNEENNVWNSGAPMLGYGTIGNDRFTTREIWLSLDRFFAAVVPLRRARLGIFATVMFIRTRFCEIVWSNGTSKEIWTRLCGTEKKDNENRNTYVFCNPPHDEIMNVIKG